MCSVVEIPQELGLFFLRLHPLLSLRGVEWSSDIERWSKYEAPFLTERKQHMEKDGAACDCKLQPGLQIKH